MAYQLTSLFLMLVIGTTSGYVLLKFPVAAENEAVKGLTCWTCPNKTDNEACNNWAPDRQCQIGHSWCRTIHSFRHHKGKTHSVSVLKECVPEYMCREEMIGCSKVGNHGEQVCISCCNENYCNEAVPESHVHALLLSESVLNSSTSPISSWASCLLAVSAIFALS